MRRLALILIAALLVFPVQGFAGDEEDSKWRDKGFVLWPLDGVANETIRTGYSSSPPCACGTTPCLGGTIWTDSDTHILYLCDDTRDKWLSVETMVLFGEETANCLPGKKPGTSSHCTVDWGDGVGSDRYANVGFYVPYDMTVVAFGFSKDVDECVSGSFDVEIWGSQSANLDHNYYLGGGGQLAVDQTGQRASSSTLDLDIPGNQYLIWGVDNSTPGCSTSIGDYNIVIYAKWRTQ
jgi:hypothetical protein